MKWEELFSQLADEFKTPETLADAIEFIKKDPTCQVTIEDLAFKQVVLNILVAAGIVSEKDFNESVIHFKDLLTKSFAEKLLDNVNKIKSTLSKTDFDKINLDAFDTVEDDDFVWPDDDKIGKA